MAQASEKLLTVNLGVLKIEEIQKRVQCRFRQIEEFQRTPLVIKIAENDLEAMADEVRRRGLVPE